MPLAFLSEIPKPQQERLAFIEFRLLFLGSINRPDLTRRFGISESAASRDLSLYRKLAPGNIEYDRVQAVYLPGQGFEPLYCHSPSQVLTALAEGVGDDLVTTPQSWLPTELSSRLPAPSLDILVPVSRALYSGKTLNIAYRSLSSGLSNRQLVPLFLVDNGLRWHLRAFDMERSRYADFVLNRIKSAAVGDTAQCAQELRLQDQDWQTQVELELVPHPKLAHPDTIAFEYGMTDKVLRIKMRAALAGYLLRRWNVDCSENYSLQGAEYLLWLRNVSELHTAHLPNLTIAPGFSRGAQRKNMEATDAKAG